MKREARVLASSCGPCSICIGIVIRGKGVDGIVSGIGCDSLCRDAQARGFMGELRYALGDCRCGLPEPPAWNPWWTRYLSSLSTGWHWLKYYTPIAACSSGVGDP